MLGVGRHVIPGCYGDSQIEVKKDTELCIDIALSKARLEKFKVTFSEPVRLYNPAGSFFPIAALRSLMPSGLGFLTQAAGSAINTVSIYLNGLEMQDDGTVQITGTVGVGRLITKRLESCIAKSMLIVLNRESNKVWRGDLVKDAPAGAAVPNLDRMLAAAAEMMPLGMYALKSVVPQGLVIHDSVGHTQAYPGPVDTDVQGDFTLSGSQFRSEPRRAKLGLTVGGKPLAAYLTRPCVQVPGTKPGLSGCLRGHLSIAPPSAVRNDVVPIDVGVQQDVTLDVSSDGLVLLEPPDFSQFTEAVAQLNAA